MLPRVLHVCRLVRLASPHSFHIIWISCILTACMLEEQLNHVTVLHLPPPLQKSITYGLWCCIINLMLLETCDPPASQTWHSSQIPDGGLMWRGETSAEGDIRAEVSKIFTGGCIPSISPTPPPCQHTISVFARKRLRSVHVSVPKTVHRICIVSNTNNYWCLQSNTSQIFSII